MYELTVLFPENKNFRLLQQNEAVNQILSCLLYTSDAADERSSVDLGGRRIIKKKKTQKKRHTHNEDLIERKIPQTQQKNVLAKN